MGPWILFVCYNVALIAFAYLALAKPHVVIGWLGPGIRSRKDLHPRYRLLVRLIGAGTVLTWAALSWLFVKYVL